MSIREAEALCVDEGVLIIDVTVNRYITKRQQKEGKTAVPARQGAR